MKTEKKECALYAISSIYNSSRNKKFGVPGFKKLEPELDLLAKRLDINREGAYLFSIIFTQYIEDEQVDYTSISKHLKCNVIDVLAQSGIINQLKNQKLITEKMSRGRFSKMREHYMIPDVVKESILEDKFPIPKEDHDIKSAVEVLEKCFELADQCEDEELTKFECFGRIRCLLRENSNFKLIDKVLKLKLANIELGILLYTFWSTLTGEESISMSRVLKIFVESSSRRINISQDFISGRNILISSSLIDLEKASFFNDSLLKLGKKGIKLLEEEGIKVAELDKRDLISHKSIRVKELFYNREEKKNLKLLSDGLENERFTKVQEQLDKKALPTGFNCMFYGPPGTGKTEGVLQIAKITGRDVMKVDISETKSKWFGDSEKLIKKIFTKYEKLCASAENVPILLFNEADAILSKRMEISDSAIAQTINTIQNILLEELENFQGIFIATTNLIDNLDPAFERRFLFKIEINRPDEEAREKIWKAKLDSLSAEQYLELAHKFEFSGGEIENITRKILMHEIINSEKIDFNEILEFCVQEKFGRIKNKHEVEKKTIIGFQYEKNENTYMAR